MCDKHPFQKAVDINRGQTGVGAVYAVTFTLLVVSGVLTFGYVYVSTPAISSADRTAEASTIAEWLVVDELAGNSDSVVAQSETHLDRQEVADFFDGNTDDIDHRAVENNEIEWSVSLVAREDTGETTIFDGEDELTEHAEGVDEVPLGGVSTYQTPAILDGDVVIVEVSVWED